MPTLDWIGKRAVVNHHRKVPYHLLRSDPALSAGQPDSGNLLIQGDNLLALKALLPYYAGQVKCIYIDPPYNTGNENWVYNDNVNSPEIRKWLGSVVGKEAEDLSRHDKWLCMMYPRLALLREFLREDGAIFVSIDDNEVGHLRLLLDEIFGRRNFVVNIAWQKRTSPDMRLAFSDALEHILVYAKASESIKFNKVPKTQTQRAQFRNPDNDPRGPWVSSDFTAQGYRPNQMYTIRTPGGTEFVPPAGVCWKTIESVFLELVRDNRIWFGRTGRSMPRRKTFLSESPGNTPWSWWPNDDVGHTQEAKKEMGRFCNSEQVFDTPKPVRLIRRVMEIASDKDSIILDSFAGSGTTGHAVLDLNKADGGNRRFVLVEMEPSVAHDITSLRLSRVINGFTYTSGTEATVFEALGGGLSYCTLSDPLFDAEGNIAASVRFPDLARHIFFTETGAPIPKRTTGRSPLLGVHQGKAVYLLFNGIMGDKRPNGGNVLTADCLKKLPPHDGPRVIYAEGTRLSPQRLKREGVIFKQIPYEIKVS